VTVFQDHLRLTPDEQSKSGYIWNRNAISFSDWEVTLSVKIEGKGRIGGDGIALWYVSQTGLVGKAFGSTEQWKGLGVFIDTFDNDNKHDNPYVSVVVNDGNMIYDPLADGKDIEVGGCRAGFRKTSGPALLRVTYRGSMRQLEVSYNLNGDWHACYSGNVDLPVGYYLGVTAATGGVSDNHDVNYLELRRLDGGETNMGIRPPVREHFDAEKEKNSKEVDLLKQQLDALKTANDGEKAEQKKKDIPASDISGRLALLEEQLNKLENKLAALSKVADGIETITKSVDQLKKKVDEKKPAAAFDKTQFKNELTKQQQELNRIALKAQETMTHLVNNRVSGIESNAKDLQRRVDDLASEVKKTGGGFMTFVMVFIMAAECCLLLVTFMKGRRANKYDKMW